MSRGHLPQDVFTVCFPSVRGECFKSAPEETCKIKTVGSSHSHIAEYVMQLLEIEKLNSEIYLVRF